MSDVPCAPSTDFLSPKTGMSARSSRNRETRSPGRAAALRLAGCLLIALSPWTSLAGELDEQRAAFDEMRKVADTLVSHVRSELTKALESSGPLRAVIVCKYSVPEISSNLSRRSGWRITRVSLRPRNPVLGAADAWEQGVLLQFEQRVARGERAEAIEFHEVVTEPVGRFLRYMRALPLGPLCIGCHGPAEGISEATRAQLALEYPHDRAIGYRPGQIRGAVTVKRPLD